MNQLKVLLALLAGMVWKSTVLAQTAPIGISDMSHLTQFVKDVSGRVLQQINSDNNVEGSAYYPEHYNQATIILNNGIKYEGIKARLNLMDNELLFMSSDGVEMIATAPVQQIIFSDSSDKGIVTNRIFQKNFPAVDQQSAGNYYEVLDTGNVKLLKYHRVSYIDKKGYHTEVVTRVYQETNIYYLYSVKKGINRVEKGKSFLISYLDDKKEVISKFIDSNNLKCKKETDWKTLITYYNTL